MKKFIIIFILLVPFCLIQRSSSACGQNIPVSPTKSKVNGTVLESTVAVVNDSIIARSQLEDKIRRELYLRGIIPSEPSSELRRRILDELIEDELLVSEARRKKIEAPPEVIDDFTDRFVRYVESIFPDRDSFLHNIDMNYIDLVDFKKRARTWEERDYLINVLVSTNIIILEKDIQEFEKTLRSEGKSVLRYRLSQIFLKFTPNATEEEKESVTSRALDILRKIQNGADFNRMAKEYSEDEATKARGGDLGELKEGKFSPSIESAVQDMKEGDVSLPITDESGIHLIRLEQKSDARSLLFRKKFDEERKKILDELRKNAVIRILDTHL